MKQKSKILTAAALFSGIFFLDILTPLGYAAWLLYLAPLLLASSVLRGRTFLLLPSAGSLFIIAGFFLSSAGIDPAIAVFNGSLGIFALWIVSISIMKRKQTEDALEQSHRGLEKRVQERTRELSKANAALQTYITEHRRTEEALRQSEAKLRAVFRSLMAGIVFLNKRGEVEEVSDAVQLYGHSLEELKDPARDPRSRLIRPGGALFPVEEQPAIVALRTGRAVRDVELGVPMPDGKVSWRLVSAQPVRDEDGNILGAVAFFFDISDRKKTEEALREREQRLHLAAAAAHLGIFEWDAQEDVPVWENDRMFEIFGIVPGSQPVNLSFLRRLLRADDLQRFEEELAESLTSGTLFRGKYRIRRPDGQWRWIEYLAQCKAVPDGNPNRLVGVLQDITERKQDEESLRRSEEKLSIAFYGTIAGIAVSRLRDGLMIDANDQWLRLFGLEREETIGKVVRQRTWKDPGERTKWKKILLDQGVFQNREIRFLKKNGEEWVGMTSARVTDLHGEPVIISSILDITDRKKTEEQLREAKELSDALNRINGVIHSTREIGTIMKETVAEAAAALKVDGSSIGLFEDGYFVMKHVYAMPKELEGLRIPKDELKGVRLAASIRDVVVFNDAFHDERVNVAITRRYGVRSLMIAPFLVRGEILGAMNFYYHTPHIFTDPQTDFTRKLSASLALAFENARLFDERSKMEERMRHLAHHDPLTGLPNRRLFLDIVGLEREQAKRNGKKMAILYLDLDRFKEVNDTLGHDAGNVLLREVSVRLKSLVRKSDTIARIGGDEFNIILADVARPEDIADVARNIVSSFRTPFRINGQELNITTSVGIGIYPDDNEDIDTLLRYADIAMYHAKELGKNGYQFYNSSINVKSLERMKLEAMLRRSLDLGEMEIYYQPLVDVGTGRVVSAEALARWHHPDKGLLPPADFIPAAEETGFINELGEWALKTVCRQMRGWQKAGGPRLRVTVNLSARQFQDLHLAKKISSILTESGVLPGMLGIEVTESTAMSNVDQSAARMKELQNMGIEVSIDDFGTGYSSLNYLKRLPIERLKIDRSFVQDVCSDRDDRTIVKAVTAMAHNMKMKVVAEGVETEGQLAFLKTAGCDEMQGFVFSEPLPAEEFRELLAPSQLS